MKTARKPYSSVFRALDDVRRGEGFRVGAHGFYPIELLDKKAKLPRGSIAVISGSRGEYLGFGRIPFAALAVKADGLTHAQLQYLADPLAKKIRLPELAVAPADEAETLAFSFVKQASLLPALIKTKGGKGEIIPLAELKKYLKNPPVNVNETARATLPLEGAESAVVASFHANGETHLALLVGDISKKKTPLVRVHSSCVTGDILGSLRCDCGSQLQKALAKIIAEGAGILLYLHQEGRGIGITNKLRAYALQEQGVDTYEANRMLGFDEDERDFAIAANILKKLKIKTCRLLTNNPDKLKKLQRRGITITERVGLAVTPGRHNHNYLSAKALKSGHLF